MFGEVRRHNARMRKATQELRDLDVERVDGVDKPATGRSFLLFKSEDSGVAPTGATKFPTASRVRGAFSLPPDPWLSPMEPYDIEEDVDADKRSESVNFAEDEASGERRFAVPFTNIVDQPAPNAARFFDLKDQPSRGAEPGNDKPQWSGLDAGDPIPSAGAGPRAVGVRDASEFRAPDGRQWVEKQRMGTGMFMCESFADCLEL